MNNNQITSLLRINHDVIPFLQCCLKNRGQVLWQDWNNDYQVDLICQDPTGGYRVFLSQGTASLIPLGQDVSATETATSSPTHFYSTVSPTATSTESKSITVSPSLTKTITFTNSGTETYSVLDLRSSTTTQTFSKTSISSMTPTISSTDTGSITEGAKSTHTESESTTSTQSPTETSIATDSSTATSSPTHSNTTTTSPTVTQTESETLTFSSKKTASSTETGSATLATVHTATASNSATSSYSTTQVFTPSPTPTDSHSSTTRNSDSHSQTVSTFVASTRTQSQTAGLSNPHTGTLTKSQTVTTMPTRSLIITSTYTQTKTHTHTLSGTNTPENKITFNPTQTETASSTVFGPDAIKTCTIDLTNSTVKPKSLDQCEHEIYYANSQVNTIFNITSSVSYVEINNFNVTNHVIYFIDFGCISYGNLVFALRNAGFWIEAPVMNESNINGNIKIVLNDIGFNKISKNNFQFQDCPNSEPAQGGGNDFSPYNILTFVLSSVLGCIAIVVAVYYGHRQLKQGQHHLRNTYRGGPQAPAAVGVAPPAAAAAIVAAAIAAAALPPLFPPALTPPSSPVIGLPLFIFQHERELEREAQRERAIIETLRQTEGDEWRAILTQEMLERLALLNEANRIQIHTLQLTVDRQHATLNNNFLHQNYISPEPPVTRIALQQDQATSPRTPARLAQPTGETGVTGLNQPTMEYAQELQAPVMPPPFAIPRPLEVAAQVRLEGIAAAHQDPVQTTVPAHRGVQAQPIQPEEVRPVPFELPLTRPHWPQTEERHALNQAVLVPEPPVTREALLAYQESVPEEQDGTYFMDDTTQGTVPAEAEWLN